MSSNDMSAKRRTKELIKEKFLEKYEKKPLAEIQVSEIIRACNISRGAFYFHFADIYALYHECESSMIAFIETGHSNVDLSTVKGEYGEYIEAYSKFLEKYVERVDMIRCFLRGSERTSFRQAWLDSIRRIFMELMEFSHVASIKERNYSSHFFAGGLQALLTTWIFDGCKEPTKVIAAIVARSLYQGLFSAGAPKKTR